MRVHCFTCMEDLAVVGDLTDHQDHNVEILRGDGELRSSWDRAETYIYIFCGSFAVFAGGFITWLILR